MCTVLIISRHTYIGRREVAEIKLRGGRPRSESDERMDKTRTKKT